MNEESMGKNQIATINRTRRRCFIVTVGTSLLGQYLKDSTKARNWSVEQVEQEGGGIPAVVACYHNQKSKDPTSPYGQAFSDLHGKIKSFTNMSDLRKASAELNSLYHMNPPPGTGDVVILIATQTPTGCLCATLLEQVLRNGPDCVARVGEVQIKQPEGLGFANDQRFADEGLPRFLECLSESVQQYKATYDLILIPTGGYKSLIPYVTLAGILHEVPVEYIYEDSDVLLDLPAVPVGLDMEHWQTGALFLEQMRGRPWDETEAWRESIGRGFSSLVVEDVSDCRARVTALGEWLIKRFKESRDRTRLQAQSGRQALLRFLARDENKPDLEKMFQQLVQIGPYLWLGDKVPEMVDHGPYHHTRLFEMADLMLVPLLHRDRNEGTKLLTAEELFIFLCVIYLHDCGHVYASFPGGPPLLPTQIREYHHILGYERLKSENWQKTMRERGLIWGNSPSEMWEKYLNVIAAIGMFHRRKMPLRESKPYCCLANNRLYQPLEKDWCLKFEDQRFTNERALFLASLFRVLDGLDNQLGRAGGPGEFQIKAAVLRDDAKAQELQAKAVQEALEAYCDASSNVVSAVKGLVEKVTGVYGKMEGAGPAQEEEIDLENEIKKIASRAEATARNGRVAANLIRLYVEAETRAFFTKTQIQHYFDHLILDAPDIKAVPRNSGEHHRIEITLRPVPKSRFDECASEFKKLCEGFQVQEYKAKIAEITGKVTREYSGEVKNILESGNLSVEFWIQKDGIRERVS